MSLNIALSAVYRKSNTRTESINKLYYHCDAFCTTKHFAFYSFWCAYVNTANITSCCIAS